MDGQSSIDRRQRLPWVATLAQDLALPLAGVLALTLCLVALVIVQRRLAGALGAAESHGWLAAWTVLAAVLAAATRAVWCAGDFPRRLPTERLVLFAPIAALLITSLVFSTLHAPPGMVALVWGIAILEEGVTLRIFGQQFRPRGRGVETAQRRRSQESTKAPLAAKRPASALLPGSETPMAAPHERLTQRLVRAQADDGNDEMSGQLGMRLAARQVNVQFHVSFCPPFAGTPQLAYRQVAGPAARVKLGQVLPHGARFDVKLDSPQNEAAQVVLEVRASHPASSTIAT